MSVSIFLLCLVTFPLIVRATPPQALFLNCGAKEEIEYGGRKWTPDSSYVDAGNPSAIETLDLLPILATVRYFHDESARKYCFVIPVTKGGKYLVRTTYFYGAFDGGKHPPVFDQIVDGTKWATVNTTDDYVAGLSSYYEIVAPATSNTMSVCLARNAHTSSSPFISTLELTQLDDSVYNATEFKKYALTTVARHSFGHDGDIISYPDDKFNRLWQPFMTENPIVQSQSNVTPTDFWNMPPASAFRTALTASRGKTLEVKWPPASLPPGEYFVSLYFQDNRSPSQYSWRVFDVSINGEKFYAGLNATTAGVTVYSAKWPLSGETNIVLTPNDSAPVGPVISAGEVLQFVPLGRRTNARDVMAMEDMAKSLTNLPPDWKGDPCMPTENSWTGVSCTNGKKMMRVTTVNLTSTGLSGSLPQSLGNLSALNNLWLGGNKLSGSIPEDIGRLSSLQTLHLEDNQLEGRIPETLASLSNLNELFLQGNKLQGSIPQNLQQRRGLNLHIDPANGKSASLE